MNQAILKAIKQLRTERKRNFTQSIDLIINLRKIDLRKFSLNLIVNIPWKIKESKVCAFLTKKSEIIDTIVKEQIERIDDKKAKEVAKQYDFFIAHASLMPLVATKLGKILGPQGKMPSPLLGVLVDESDSEIKELVLKIEKTVKVKSKDLGLKILAGKENMKDEEIAENTEQIVNSVINALPNKKDNVKSIMIKLTMSKPVKIIEDKGVKEEK